MKRFLSAAILLVVSGLSLAAFGPEAEEPATKPAAARAGQAGIDTDKPGKDADKPAGAGKRKNGRAQAAAQAAKAAQAAQEPTPPPPPSASEAGVPLLSSGDSYDDFASVAEAPDGSLYAAYAAYFDGHDQIRMHKRLPSGKWSTRLHVPLAEARADIWMPQIAVDAQGRVWVIWSEQTGQTSTSTGNWDIYARSFNHDSWGPLVRISDHPKPDINPYVTVDAKRNIYVVWQGHADNTGDVMLARFNGEEWSKPLAVTTGPESDWFPQADVDAQGKVWIAFDSYRNDDYDVFLTSVDGDRVGEIVPIATSKLLRSPRKRGLRAGRPRLGCLGAGRL